MNPIGMLCIGLSSGCGAGLVRLLDGLRAAQATQAVISPPEPETEPVSDLDADRGDWDGELAAVAKELADARKKRAAAQAVRADTLRNIYLADPAAAESEEVAAR